MNTTTENPVVEAPVSEEQKQELNGILGKVFTYWGKASKTVLKDEETRKTIYDTLENSELLTALLGPKIAGAADGFKVFLGTDTDAILKHGFKGKAGTKLLNDGITAGSKQLGYHVAKKYLGLRDAQAAVSVGGLIGTLVGNQASTIIFKKLGIPVTDKQQNGQGEDATGESKNAEQIAKEAIEKYKAEKEAKKAEKKAKKAANKMQKKNASLQQQLDATKAELQQYMQGDEKSEPAKEKPAEEKINDTDKELTAALKENLEGTGIGLNSDKKEEAKKETEKQLRMHETAEAKANSQKADEKLKGLCNPVEFKGMSFASSSVTEITPTEKAAEKIAKIIELNPKSKTNILGA